MPLWHPPKSAPNATVEVRGIVELATQTEADAGTDTERAMTPAITKEALRKSYVAANCKLVYVSATQIRLDRCNGTQLTIGYAVETIPAAGVTLANSGLGASTLYYIYAYMNAGVMTLLADGTAPTQWAGNGMLTHPGNGGMTLVGMIRTTNIAGFANNGQQRLVRSYFNDQGISGNTLDISGSATASSAWVVMGGTAAEFLSWAEELVDMHFSGSAYTNTAGGAFFGAAIAYDSGSSILAAHSYSSPAAPNYHGPFGVGHKIRGTQGYHLVYPAAHANGCTASFSTSILFVQCNGSGA